MGQYSIKDVETLSGIKAHTLRMWELRYDFLKPERTDTNIRYYSDEQLKLILNICTLNRNGMRISKIACLEQDQLCKEVEKLSQQNGEPNAVLDALIHSMIDFDEARFEKTLSCAIMKHGFEKAFGELIFPLMQRTGVLWSTGTIRPAQEHFISNLIRRKISAAIENQYVKEDQHTKRFALFLPEGETHELMLLFTEYILRERHHHVTYIGSSLPFAELDFINRSFRPDYWVTSFSLAPAEMPLQEYINKMANAFPQQKIVVGGKQLDLQKPVLPGNVFPVKCMKDLLTIVD
jgi:DNA-binding transcriptional MerR regulator